MHTEKQDCSTYRAVIKLVKRHHEPPVLLYFRGFPRWLAWFSRQIFCLNNKIHFSLANTNNSNKFHEKNGLKMTVFAYSQTTNKLVNEAANDSARVSGQDRKKPPALGTNQIAGFGGFRPLASLEKIKPVNKLNCRYISCTGGCNFKLIFFSVLWIFYKSI